MRAGIVFVLVLMVSTFCYGQQKTSALPEAENWPKPPKVDYPKKGKKNHKLDYLFVDVADWEKYCAGSADATNVEIPAQLTYYTSDDEFVFSTGVGIRLSGIFIRKLPQKSIAVDFGKKWGSDKVFYEMFPSRDYDRVRSFVIRAHGNPLARTFFKDALANEAVAEHTELEYSAARPVVLYLNGEYHGLYNLREKKNKDMIRNVHGIGKGEIEIFDVNGGVSDPRNEDYEAIVQYCKNNDMSTAANYDWFNDRVEIDNMIDYFIAHCFFGNTDWPKANVKVWRPKGGKFRFLFFDCDRGMTGSSAAFNHLEHITGQDQWAKNRGDNKVDERLNQSTVLIREMMKNQRFADAYVMRYQDLLNSAYSTSRMLERTNEYAESIESEVTNHMDYWKTRKNDASYQTVETYLAWEGNLKQLRTFFEIRPDRERGHLIEKFSLGKQYSLTFGVNDTEAGYLWVNSVKSTNQYFRGEFFAKFPITLKAMPKSGYKFDHWEGYSSTSSQITLRPAQVSESIKAVFVKE